MRIIFFTGAGLSAESGIPTFRDAGGLYDGIPAEKWLTAQNYSDERWRPQIDEWHDRLRDRIAVAEPNAAHRMIAQACAIHDNTLVLTQNIDDLLERAGVPESRILHLHGDSRFARCRRHGGRILVGDRKMEELRCPDCAQPMRADVVLFHEHAPLYRTMWRAFDELTTEDLLVVIGTRGDVISIGEVARMTPARTVLNNLHPNNLIEHAVFDHVFLEPATTAAPKILEIIRQWTKS